MIRINLLPIKQIKEREKTRKEVIVFAGSFASLLVGLMLIGYMQSQKINGLQEQIAQLEAKKKSYALIIREIEQLKKMKTELERKIGVIATLQKGAKLTVRVLDEIANRTPSSRVWLKSLSHSEDKLRIDGVALDNETVAQYMKSIKESPFFADADPDLSGTTQTSVSGRNLSSFSLAINVKIPQGQATE